MIEIEGLTKVFQGTGQPVPVLKDVSLSIRQGEIFGIMGRSGAGKSTLVRCINLLERPTEGRVQVAGREITMLTGAALRQARRSIGMIFQHFNLLSSRTVYGNVAFPLELAGKSSKEIKETVLPLLTLVGLDDKLDRYPAELSGGQKQRIGIARALSSQPTVLLCDEATSALDPETTKAILTLLRDINRQLKLTIVLITHEMEVIKQICDRVAVLDQGRVVEQGTVFDVFTAPQADVTQRFVRDVMEHEMPEGLSERLRERTSDQGHPLIRIVFTGPSANCPIIAEVVRRFDILLNILQGSVDYIQGLPYGNILVEAIGSDREIQKAIDYIHAHNLRAEIIGHVIDND